MRFLLDEVPSPLGTILIVSDGEALRALDFDSHEARMRALLDRRHREYALVRDTAGGRFARAVRAYFDGDLAALDGLPVRGSGTPFQERVWAALRGIPVGRTISYGALAARIGQPTASRAVGMANGANPVAIVVPCHRVIGADSRLTGYGGGLERKRWLLDHERAEPERAGNPAGHCENTKLPCDLA